MSLSNLNSSNSKSMLVNTGIFKAGVYITSPNQFLTYTDSNGMNSAYYYSGPLPYTTSTNNPSTDSSYWKILFIAGQYSFLKSDIVPITSGGTGANNISDARINLGLGTASVQNIGTSGSNVPLLSTSNTWSSSQIFNGSLICGSTYSGGSGYGIEIGPMSVANQTFIDFHTSGTGNDYDTRIIATGGSSTVGAGNIAFVANRVSIPQLSLTTPLAITSGGTGASTVAAANTALGLGTSDTPTFQSLNIQYASNEPKITLNNGIIRANTGNALIISNQQGLYFRPAGDAVSTIQINYTSAGVLAMSGTSVTISGGLTLGTALPLTSGGTGATTATGALTNLGLVGMGIGGNATTLSTMDWQQQDFITGALYVVAAGGMTNIPTDLIFEDTTTITLIRVIGNDGSFVTAEIWPSTSTESKFRLYNMRFSAGSKGSRQFWVRRTWDSSSVVPLVNGGTGATTADAAATALGLGTSNSVVFSTITSQYTKNSGLSSFSPTAQGSYLNWNQVSGSGKTDFINHRGNGGGGFNFWNGTTSQSLILQITGSGNVILNNNISLQSNNSASSPLDLIKIDTGNILQIGNITIPTVINSSINPTVKVGSNAYTIYTTGNKPDLSAFRAGYYATAGSDLKQTITTSNTPQTLNVNTISQSSSFITANTTNGTFLFNTTQGMMFSLSAELIRETAGTGDAYWLMFLESSTDGTTWTTVQDSSLIITLSSASTSEIKHVNFSMAIQAVTGTYVRIRHATTDSTKTISVISKDSLFAGAPISPGVLVNFLTL